MSSIEATVSAYSDGFAKLQASLHGVDEAQLDLRPVAGKWSIREVVCHLADAEIIYADRIKRVLVEDDPTFFEADPNQFREALANEKRAIEAELNVVKAIREHMTPILRSLNDNDFQRSGQHSLDGPMTIVTLLERITNHIPHHVRFIDEKVAAIKS